MRSFLEQYGTAIFTLVIISILIAFAGPVGTIIKTNVNTQIQNMNEIGSERVRNPGRAEEPEEAVDQVYCILYDNGELTISQTEITPYENRTVLNKGYFTKPKDVDTTEGKQHIITVRFVGGVKPKSCQQWFGAWIENGDDSTTNSCIYLTEIKNIENLYTNECTNMDSMFYNCESIVRLDLHNFDTKKVDKMFWMFYNCKSLTTLDISDFDTSKVRNMRWMFYSCKSLTTLDLSSFDTNNVTDMAWMFYNCNSLTNLNLGNKFDTSNVTNMYCMFINCNSLTTLDLSNFNTSKVTNMTWMFGNCLKLILDCSSWNVSKVTNYTSFNKNSPNVITPTWKN